jgi:hypothetical protein
MRSQRAVPALLQGQIPETNEFEDRVNLSEIYARQ